MQNVNVSVVLFARDKVEPFLVVQHISNELILDPGKTILLAAIDHVVLFSVGENYFFKVVRYLNHKFVGLLQKSN